MPNYSLMPHGGRETDAAITYLEEQVATIPAIDTPSTDLTATLQAAADAGKPMVVPQGRHYITNTITIPFGSGQQIRGIGVGDDSNQHTTNGGSILEYQGPAGEPMFLSYASQLEISGVNLDCDNLAGYGLHMVKPPNPSYDPEAPDGTPESEEFLTGLSAPGKTYSPFLRVENATIAAIGAGGTSGDHHCDELQIGRMEAINCARVFKAINQQSMKHIFGHAHVYLTPIGFEYEGGGSLVVQSATVLHSCDLLVLNAQESQIGSNNSQYRIANVKVDNQGAENFRLVRMDERALHSIITIDGVRSSNDGTAPGRPLLTLDGPAVVTIRDMHRIVVDSIESSQDGVGDAIVRLECCSLVPATAAELLVAGFDGTLQVRDCFRYPAVPFADTDITQ